VWEGVVGPGGGVDVLGHACCGGLRLLLVGCECGCDCRLGMAGVG
jgi:hypothetical protein